MDIMTNPGFAKLYKQAFPEVGEMISENLPTVTRNVGKSNLSKGIKLAAYTVIAGAIFYLGYKLYEEKFQNNTNQNKN
jgi:hypothetical protein